MGNWKLRIRIDNKSKTRANPELFNLADDISEANNLASQMPDKVTHMSKILYQAETDQLTNSQK